MKRSLLNAAVVCSAVASAAPVAHSTTEEFTQACQSFAKTLKIPRGRVTGVDFVPAGTTLNFPNLDPTCGPKSQFVSAPMCRVQANITTSCTSGLRFEAWLPQNWTGRFLSTGNGGLGGCIQYADLEWTASLGFAAVATNNGHDGMGAEPFYKNPGVVEDYVYRAVHTGIVTGKRVTKAFYGQPHTKSYYLGCSTGGRQGMKMVQDFPDSFDGVVSGAPAINMNNLNTWSAHFLPVTGTPTSDTFVSRELWGVVHQDILDQCDERDGHKDGILEAPDLCRYKADGLLCGAGKATAPNCLTDKQVNTVNTIFSEMRAPNGTGLYPRMQPGSELVGAIDIYYSGFPLPLADWLKYVVLEDPNFDLHNFTPDMWTLSDTLDPFGAATMKSDLSEFKKRGGKLLHYHGLMDAVITSDISPRYYELVSKTMNLPPAQLDEFYRYFRISGMGHCSGGPGAHYIGNGRSNLAYPDKPDQSVLMSLVRWVEQGKAPDTITGVAFVNGTQGGQVASIRNHCRWPLMNKFQGGDPNSADSWKCISYNATT